MAVSWGACRESQSAPLLWPWVQVLRQAGGPRGRIAPAFCCASALPPYCLRGHAPPGDGGAWLDGDAARAIACDATITPIVTGDIDPSALDDLVALCLQAIIGKTKIFLPHSQ